VLTRLNLKGLSNLYEEEEEDEKESIDRNVNSNPVGTNLSNLGSVQHEVSS